jgi:hypothetical protein
MAVAKEKKLELLTGDAVLRIPWRTRLWILVTGRAAFTCRHVLDKPLDGPPGPSHVELRAGFALRKPVARETSDRG